MRKMRTAATIFALSTSVCLAEQPGDALTKADHEKAALDRICSSSPDVSARDSNFSKILGQSLLLSDAQKAALKDYQDAQAKAIADAKFRLCANKPDLSSFEASLNFRQKMLEDALDAMKVVNPKLIAFYDSLNAEQQARFDQMREHMARRTKR